MNVQDVKRADGWKEKESKLMGLRCKKCGTEIACDDEGKYICPTDGLQYDKKQYDALDKEAKDALDELIEWADKKDDSKFKEALETLEKSREAVWTVPS